MLSLCIVTCTVCGKQEKYQGEYNAIVAAISERWRKWDRRTGKAECREHDVEKS